MKKGYLFLCSCCMLINVTFAQHNNSTAEKNAAPRATYGSAVLDLNEVHAYFDAAGALFGDGTQLQYWVPQSAVNHVGTLFNAGLWVGGIDAGNQLHISAQTYRQNGADFWQGYLDDNGTALGSNDFNYVWKLLASTVTNFKANFIDHNHNGTLDTTYIPQDIWSWPAKGNTHAFGGNGAFAVADTLNLAPFFDNNQNGIYDPEHGDYPLIKGDQALWWTFTDNGPTHSETGSGSMPLKFEIHAMAYEYASTDPDINNTIFLSFSLHNKSLMRYNDVRVGIFADFDIGCFDNDYIGCDSTLNYFYGYNGTPTDPSCASIGYDNNPPVQTVQSFTNSTYRGESPMKSFISYKNDNTVQGNPSAPDQYFSLLNGKWSDGTPLTLDRCSGYGGSVPATYMYPGNPAGSGTFPANWTAATCSNIPTDIRGLGSAGPFTIYPGDVIQYDIATTTLFNVGAVNQVHRDTLYNHMNRLKSFFEGDTLTRADTLHMGPGTGVTSNIDNIVLTVYPNPSSGTFSVISNTYGAGATLSIFDMLGREVQKVDFSGGQHSITIKDKGIYTLRYTCNGRMQTKKLVVQ